jgi:protein TonB
LERQRQGEQLSREQPTVIVGQYSPEGQTGKLPAERMPSGKPQVVISPEEVVFGTRFGETKKEEPKKQPRKEEQKAEQTRKVEPKKEQAKSETKPKDKQEEKKTTRPETRAWRPQEKYTPQVRALR